VTSTRGRTTSRASASRTLVIRLAPLPSVLIANRGEIAVRIATTARALGMRVIAVYSDADAQAPHVQAADEAWHIGPSSPRESYLVAERILDVAKRSGAASIHPGYGFLSENAAFAEACASAGIVFVGPPAAAIKAMGLKDAAKALMQAAQVPVVPGYHGERQETDFLRTKAYEIGYPVLIKAVAGGGGKGMRRVDRQIDFDAALESAQREAANAFGDPRVLVEKYVSTPRHVEIQVFGDSQGNVVSLFERDCSLQRRHQKVIEEAPAPGMSAEMRRAMGEAACAAAKAVGYVGAGTVEFIADGSSGLRENSFYFMEMNTRLQVEHPVTEAITGLDLVALQFHVAAGHPLPFSQSDLKINGHAVEARLYAEEPERGFLPSTGKLHAVTFASSTTFRVAPDGVRIDSGVRTGGEVSPYYDPMIAKIIAHGQTRDEALDRLSKELEASLVVGPKTNARFLIRLANLPEFRAGTFDTGTIERNIEALAPAHTPASPSIVAAGAAHVFAGPASPAHASPWNDRNGFQLGGTRSVPVSLKVDEETVLVRMMHSASGATFEIAGETVVPHPGARLVPTDDGVVVVEDQRQIRVSRPNPRDILDAAVAGDGAIRAPMHGKVTLIGVETGQRVTKGDKLAIVEAMKMEHALLAPSDGVVAEVLAAAGDQVSQGVVLLRVEADA
jgi:3-methylcrotonyl-CoA carboxylase alpha subunit